MLYLGRGRGGLNEAVGEGYLVIMHSQGWPIALVPSGPSGCHRFSSFRCFPKTFHTNLLVSEEVWHANTGQKPHSQAQAPVQQLLSFIQQTPLLLIIPISSEVWCQNLNVTLGRTQTLVDK